MARTRKMSIKRKGKGGSIRKSNNTLKHGKNARANKKSKTKMVHKKRRHTKKVRGSGIFDGLSSQFSTLRTNMSNGLNTLKYKAQSSFSNVKGNLCGTRTF